ncbi:MAG TPA: non-canonical purine NTP pyrophosphatase [Acidobacteriaceae bacterium]|nr:non-canonical purine NTP pyrophosphatase [Acidobacteriaceae bacterium]
MILSAATSNPGKLRDFAWAAQGYLPGGEPVEIVPLPGLSRIPPPVEDGATFEENARLKAVYYSRCAPEAWVVADDSGLEVDSLGGRPGVRSARFAEDVGPRSDAEEMGIALSGAEIDERNNATLLQLIEGVPAEKRAARYRCVLALARCGEVAATAEGLLEGRMLFAPRGAGGFGYDPLFLLPDLNLTMAEIDPGTRLKVSHRGRALRVLLERIQQVPLIARDVR